MERDMDMDMTMDHGHEYAAWTRASRFLICIDRTRPEYEPLLILKFSREPHDLITETNFFTQFWRNTFGKPYFSEIFLISRNLFQNI
jgi:hypothetical protein